MYYNEGVNNTTAKGKTMIRISITTNAGQTFTKTVDRMATPNSGIPCFVKDVVYGAFSKSQVKSIKWKFA